MKFVKDTLGCPPSQDASHHQDFYVFSRGSRDPYKPSLATVTGKGEQPKGYPSRNECFMIQVLHTSPNKTCRHVFYHIRADRKRLRPFFEPFRPEKNVSTMTFTMPIIVWFFKGICSDKVVCNNTVLYNKEHKHQLTCVIHHV